MYMNNFFILIKMNGYYKNKCNFGIFDLVEIVQGFKFNRFFLIDQDFRVGCIILLELIVIFKVQVLSCF